MKQLLCAVTFLTLLAPAAAAANAAPPANEPQKISMSIRPVAPPTPALKYRLLPPAVDRTPGDAAPLYLLALGAWPEGEGVFGNQMLSAEQAKTWGVDEGLSWVDVFLKVPLTRLKSPELDKVLEPLTSAFPMLELAGRREHCNWGLPLREQGFNTLLPHLSTMRNVTRVICVKARSELSRGEFDAAFATLRVNFALVRNLDKDAVLVQQLVGAAIATMSLEVLREAASLPGCPNLYWALSDLPTPLLDIRESLEVERAAIYWTMPELKKAEQGTFTFADWQALQDRLRPLLNAGRGEPTGSLQEAVRAVGSAVLTYAQARQHLIDRGMTPEQADRVPLMDAVARYLVGSYEEAYDDLVKWASLPYWQARRQIPVEEKKFRERLKAQPGNILLQVVPSVQRATHVLHNLDRLIAAQQTVEALRAYAAMNEGKLPPTLEDLTQMPAPLDPMTGKPFIYKVDGATATLESLSDFQPADGLIMTVTIVR